MRLDLTKLGAGLLAAAPLLTQFGSSKLAWWTGFCMAVAGPICLALKPHKA